MQITQLVRGRDKGLGTGDIAQKPEFTMLTHVRQPLSQLFAFAMSLMTDLEVLCGQHSTEMAANLPSAKRQLLSIVAI